MEYGYKEIVPPDRALAIDFNVGGVGAFTVSDIVEYFALLSQKTASQPLIPTVTEEEASRILNVTQGVPLAVKIAAGLYQETLDLTLVTEEAENRKTIVDGMVRRYLLHARDDQSERVRLYGLALLRRVDQPLSVAAALGLSPEQAKTSYERELIRLNRRYNFIFTEKERPSLHQEVRYFLRLWLLEHHNQPEIKEANERLREAHKARLHELEESRGYPSLRDRLEDEEWVGTYLDLMEQEFWLDPAQGVQRTLPCMLAAAIYRRDANQDAANIGDFFEQVMVKPYSDWWNWAVESLTYTSNRFSTLEERTGLEELARVASRRGIAFPSLLPESRQELEAALWWRMGEAYQEVDDDKSLKYYEQALKHLGGQVDLQETVTEAYVNVANKAYEEEKYQDSLSLLNKAITLLPEHAADFTNYGGNTAVPVVCSHRISNAAR